MLTCAALQIAGMLILLYVEIADAGEDSETDDPALIYCRGSEGGDPLLKFLGIFFAIWISLVVADQMVDVSQYGLYSYGTAQPPFVNNVIIYFGLITNLFVSILCWLTAIWLMYFSENAIDLILNGLAIYFMKTIDDEMVFGHDYKLIEGIQYI